jgi:hypothetical protein
VKDVITALEVGTVKMCINNAATMIFFIHFSLAEGQFKVISSSNRRKNTEAVIGSLLSS